MYKSSGKRRNVSAIGKLYRVAKLFGSTGALLVALIALCAKKAPLLLDQIIGSYLFHLPMGEDSSVQFTQQSKNEMYGIMDAWVYRAEGDPKRFSYWLEDPVANELEDQFTSLLREYTGEGEYLSSHAPEEPGYYDDASSMTPLGCLGAAQRMTGENVIL